MAAPDRACPDYPNECVHPWAHARTYAEVKAAQASGMTNPTGLTLLAEVAADKVYRDQAGRSYYRTWSNEVTSQVAELVDAGWLSTRLVDGQWLLTAAGQAALKRPRITIAGNSCCGGNGVEASCEVCRRD